MSRNVRKRRAKLWKEKNGICYWCGRETVLPVRGLNTRIPPANLATLDHLRTRLRMGFDEYGEPLPGSRNEPNLTNEERTVLSCNSCNNLRGLLDQKCIQDYVIVYKKPMHIDED